MPQAGKAFVTPDVSKPPIQAVMEQTENYTKVTKFIQIHFLKTIPEAKDQGTKNWVHLHYITLTAKHYITLALHSITLAAKNKPRQFFFLRLMHRFQHRFFVFATIHFSGSGNPEANRK